jgi:hypothetical protein
VRCKTDVALRTRVRPDVEEDVERRRKVARQFGGVLKYSRGRELLLTEIRTNLKICKQTKFCISPLAVAAVLYGILCTQTLKNFTLNFNGCAKLE